MVQDRQSGIMLDVHHSISIIPHQMGFEVSPKPSMIRAYCSTSSLQPIPMLSKEISADAGLYFTMQFAWLK